MTNGENNCDSFFVEENLSDKPQFFLTKERKYHKGQNGIYGTADRYTPIYLDVIGQLPICLKVADCRFLRINFRLLAHP
jgi:hypothetical protein